MECSMNVLYKQKANNESKKLEIAASLEAAYKGLSFEGGLKVSA